MRPPPVFASVQRLPSHIANRNCLRPLRRKASPSKPLLGLVNALPVDRTLFKTEVLPVLFHGHRSGAICSGLQIYGVLCTVLHHDAGSYRALVESEPISPPVIIWQIPTVWMPPPPLSAPMSPPAAP